jgi:tryptophanyl-tRNA synthetase
MTDDADTIAKKIRKAKTDPDAAALRKPSTGLKRPPRGPKIS